MEIPAARHWERPHGCLCEDPEALGNTAGDQTEARNVPYDSVASSHGAY